MDKGRQREKRGASTVEAEEGSFSIVFTVQQCQVVVPWDKHRDAASSTNNSTMADCDCTMRESH